METASLVAIVVLHGRSCRYYSPRYAFTFPLAAAIFAYLLPRSAFVILKQGGLVMQETSTS